MLRRYQRRRWLDLICTMVATDALVRIFSNQQPLLRWLRCRLLQLLKSSATLRKLSLKMANGGWAN
jgi:2-octaprenyl-6-methoxyphenol hydroxylase